MCQGRRKSRLIFSFFYLFSRGAAVLCAIEESAGSGGWEREEGGGGEEEGRRRGKGPAGGHKLWGELCKISYLMNGLVILYLLLLFSVKRRNHSLLYVTFLFYYPFSVIPQYYSRPSSLACSCLGGVP